MGLLEVEPQQWKNALAWTGEKVGRLKLNGEIRTYSPLSRVVEFEGLTIGVTAKLSMWKNLKRLQESDARLAEFDFERLVARAEQQLGEIERRRVSAAAAAFADD